MAALYNEIDPYAAQWLRSLIKAGLIPDGEVNTNSIVDLRPSDLAGFQQVHLFAGIGGWSQALRLAGWPSDRPVWTASCPCQPFSEAGKGLGKDDPRHLWPQAHRLIRDCRPPVVLGEQVARKAGRGWFDGVRSDLEGDDYSVGAVDLTALAVNAPHVRQRLYWNAIDRLADPHEGGWRWWSHDGGRQRDWQTSERIEGYGYPAGRDQDRFWDYFIWAGGADGKSRRIQPSIPLMVNGLPRGVANVRPDQLRCIGNAIVPPLAAEVIKALMETLDV
jgi:DNA (cytosine-5)-methyltransferase 1